mmetsp:Transcript_7145/g.13658  ORF Transcript_7145/g.13658 Transcript_7145/m.13658 type:complete len:452 (+) Transcript_7145:77-1432(+)
MKLLRLIFWILCLWKKLSKVCADGADDCSPDDKSCRLSRDKIEDEDEPEYNEDEPSEEVYVGEEEEEETCFDVADDCDSRAMNDSCILNFATMSEECEMTCKLCARNYNMLHISNAYSLVPQLLYSDESLEEFVTKIDQYVYETIYRGNHPDNVKLHCKNKDPQCSYWARDGDCERYPEFMADRCPAACMVCESGPSYSARCPFDPQPPGIWKAGDLNAMFTHLVTSPETAEYSPTVISRPISNPNPKFHRKDGPWIVLLDKFLSEDETEALLELVESTDYESVMDENDLFDVLFCDDECSESEIVTAVEKRLEFLTGVPAHHNEVFTFFKYSKGSFHGLKSDYEPRELSFAQGPRILTVTIFLNDIPQHEDDVHNENPNGGLYFESTESLIFPSRGSAVIFPNVLDKYPTARESRTQYEALPIWEGVLNTVTVWVHQRDYKTPLANDCVD